MATAPILPSFVPVEEYLKSDYEPHCEYLDGVLLSKALLDRTHSRLQALIAAFLLSQESKFKVDVVTEIHVRISPTRWRVPDIGGLSVPPQDGRYPDASAPPLFTIEIASLDESWPVLRGKVSDHLAIGVSRVIIADPYNKTVMVASPERALHELTHPLVVNVPVPGQGQLSIDFDDLYSKL